MATLFDGLTKRHSAERIIELTDDLMTKISGIESCSHCIDTAKELREIVNGIKEEAVSIKDSSSTAQAQFIEPSELFDGGIVPDADASGAFSQVVYVEYLGQKVAVKINSRNNDPEDFWNEIATLSAISHENIISFRGWGYTEDRSQSYLVMEHVEKTLLKYVRQYDSHENRGLSSRVAWDISNQLVRAMVYLHSRKIVHADFKPDNILIITDSVTPKPKICDFGRAYHGIHSSDKKPKGHVRYRPPDKEQTDAAKFDDYMKFDVLAFGLVLLFMKTGELPYKDCKTGEIEERHAMMMLSILSRDGEGYKIRGTRLPNTKFFNDLIQTCCGEASERLPFPVIQEKYFGRKMTNPFDIKQYGDFFESGFLKNTYIHVADSIAGKYRDDSRPTGYERDDLLCEVETGRTEDRQKPADELLSAKYIKEYRRIKEKIRSNEFNEHVAVALTFFKPYPAQGEGRQRVTLRFKDVKYSHHRAMRMVWKSLDVTRKKEFVPDLGQVNKTFSTSFGVHVAIITNEGPGKPGKFVFAKRTIVEEKPSPGMYTCGAVRGCKAEDYLTAEEVKGRAGLDESKSYVSLIKAAAKGLQEEIGLELDPVEWDAITFQTIYLKFDNHEWGIGGFVDLSHDKIQEKNRLNFATLRSIFSSGPKGRYENISLDGADFDLDDMVAWIRRHEADMASSAKIVAFKVMEAHFGFSEVATVFSD